MADISQTNWTEIDAQNNYAAPLGWTPGTMLPSQVEPTAQMMMGALKRFWNRANPIYAAVTSITDVYTATPNVPITSLTAFEEFNVRFSGPNLTTSPSFIFANTPQQTIKKYSMSSLTALSPGDIQGHDHRVYWDNTQMILANPTSGNGSPLPTQLTKPQIFTTTSGTGIYTTPSWARILEVELVGGGAGGNGSGTSPGTATTGGTTVFGTAFLTATGGSTAAGASGFGTGGDINSAGSSGEGSQVVVAGVALAGSPGGMAPIYGVITFGIAGSVGPGASGYGSGGPGGGGTAASVNPAAGGSAGGYCYKLITSISATYNWAVAPGGLGASNGTGGFSGGNGSPGLIKVIARAQ